MGQVGVPAVLMFVANHGYHLCYGVVDAFDDSLTARVVGACREKPRACKQPLQAGRRIRVRYWRGGWMSIAREG